MKNFSKNIILWIVIGLLLIALFNLFQNSSSTNSNSEISFSDFFSEPGGDKEYMEISKKTEWIFINDFISCNDDLADLIRRFISFIDICYRNKMKIKFFFNNYSCNDLYTGDKLKELWNRCQSRINEMQSMHYLTNTKE